MVVTLTGFAQGENVFNKASAAYNEGDFNSAIENYLAIINTGQHSAEVYFNLGNAYYKLNQVAPSIYYYEKALLMSPNDAEIKNNLGYAQNMTLDAIETMPQTSFSKVYDAVIGLRSFDQWAYIAVAFVILFVLLYLAFYFLRYAGQKRIAFIGAIVSLLITLVSVIFAFLQYNTFQDDQPAIVFDDEVSVKSEPNPRSQQLFELHAGTKLQVLEELNDWKKIKIIDGQTGWLSADSIKLLKDF